MRTLNPASVLDALDDVIDPELGVPIVELGLVYGVEVSGGDVVIEMTTTTPVCPLGSYLEREVERALAAEPGVSSVEVRLVHSPPWCPQMMSDTARRMLGWTC